jgi:hypothetical protein
MIIERNSDRRPHDYAGLRSQILAEVAPEVAHLDPLLLACDPLVQVTPQPYLRYC